jgi:hypothetical protein
MRRLKQDKDVEIGGWMVNRREDRRQERTKISGDLRTKRQKIVKDKGKKCKMGGSGILQREKTGKTIANRE